MGFNAPDQQALEAARNTAVQSHTDYWNANGGTPKPEVFSAGYDQGWNTAISALSSGNSLPDDLESWGKQRAGECNISEEDWEWVHGFKQGVVGAQTAGTTE